MVVRPGGLLWRTVNNFLMSIDLALTLEAPAGRSIQWRVYDRLRLDILAGRFQPGERLPSSRALARSLRVSRTTAVLAYEQLQAEGYVESRPASGTFVSKVLPPDGQAGAGTVDR